jgi:hypothetical protein
MDILCDFEQREDRVSLAGTAILCFEMARGLRQAESRRQSQGNHKAEKRLDCSQAENKALSLCLTTSVINESRIRAVGGSQHDRRTIETDKSRGGKKNRVGGFGASGD